MKNIKKLIKKSLPYVLAFMIPMLLLGLCLFFKLKTEFGDLTIFFSDMTGQYIPLFKYLGNVFNDAWMEEHNLIDDAISENLEMFLKE